MTPSKDIHAATKRCFEAYETGDLEEVMAAYTDDVAYWDTKSGKVIQGKAELRPYLASRLGRLDTRFAILEEHRLEGIDGAMVMCQCAARQRGVGPRLGDKLALQRSMNLFAVRDGLISRHESYLDLAALERSLEP